VTHTVRITKRPWEEVEVDDADYTDLKRQGLLVETTNEPAPPPAAKKTPAPPASGATKEG
jgi:hypothetical protein